jgi:hypothetical protein
MFMNSGKNKKMWPDKQSTYARAQHVSPSDKLYSDTGTWIFHTYAQHKHHGMKQD